jgi:hypothetical protein
MLYVDSGVLIAWARQRSPDGGDGSEHLPPGPIRDAAACLAG